MMLTIDPRFRGPSSSGNGGYVAGLLADRLGGGITTVTLRQPPPLGVALDLVDGDESLSLVDGDATVADAVPGDPAVLSTIESVGVDDARHVARDYPGLRRHPFPECFVCGPDRAAGDGMRLFPGRIEGGRTACTWKVGDDLADTAHFVWAALDCPGGWAAPIEGRPMVLGRMTAEVSAVPSAGEECVVMGLLLESEGRKTWTATTAYGADGRVLGRAHATWITVPT